MNIIFHFFYIFASLRFLPYNSSIGRFSIFIVILNIIAILAVLIFLKRLIFIIKLSFNTEKYNTYY